MAKLDKAQRKAMLKARADGERQKARAAFPLADDVLGRFFTDVSEQVERTGCFHDIRHAEAAMGSLALSPEAAENLLHWCREHGGFCDCEIVANAQEHWQENRERGTGRASV